MASPEWYREKAAHYRAAWLDLFGAVPSFANIAIGMSPPVLETRCGDAWPGPDGTLNTSDDERNWGALNLGKVEAHEREVIAGAARELLTEARVDRELDVEAGERLEFTAVPQRWQWWLLRPDARGKLVLSTVRLTAVEAAAVAPLTPTVAKGHEVRAKAVTQLIRDRLPRSPASPLGREPDGRTGAIHCDSHPGLGPFFVWFETFADHTKAARRYLQVLCGMTGQRPARRVCESGGTAYELAAAMYGAGYYGGFHVKDKDYPDPLRPGTVVKGSVLNIRAYANLIARHQPSIRAALESQDDEDTKPDHPSDVPLPQRNLRRGLQGRDVTTWQDQLKKDGWAIAADGIFGTQTDAATRGWQASRKLEPDGIVGPLTRAAIGSPASRQSSSSFRAVKEDP